MEGDVLGGVHTVHAMNVCIHVCKNALYHSGCFSEFSSLSLKFICDLYQVEYRYIQILFPALLDCLLVKRTIPIKFDLIS